MRAPRSRRPVLLSESVDEELDVPAPIADIDVEAFAFHEQLTNLAQGAPVRSLMKAPCPGVLQLLLAAKTRNRV